MIILMRPSSSNWNGGPSSPRSSHWVETVYIGYSKLTELILKSYSKKDKDVQKPK